MIFTIYSKPGCSHCQKFKSVCELSNLEHVVYELDTDFTSEQFYKTFGEGATFPQVQLDKNEERVHLGGCKDSITYMKNNEICCLV
jgi:glutaredoxin